MSVKYIDNEAFHGYRARRTAGGKLYQEYFSVKAHGKRLARNKATARDKELEAMQVQHKRETRADRCFHKDGSVRGISLIYKQEKSGSITPIYQTGVMSEIEGGIICTSFSINAHGVAKAWEMAVGAFIKHKKIKKDSALHKKLIQKRVKFDKSKVKKVDRRCKPKKKAKK